MLISGWTDEPEALKALGKLAKGNPNLERLEILAYNSLAENKWTKLGWVNPLRSGPKPGVTEAQLKRAEELARSGQWREKVMRSELELKQDIVEVGRRIWLRGYVAANDGNISIKTGPDEFLCTPTGVSKGFMTPEMIIKVNGAGEALSGDLKPSSEIKMHLRAYRERPDVNAVVHAHPPVSTAFAVAGIPLIKKFLPEVIVTLGEIPLTRYATPSTDEVPEAITELIKDHDAILLANHGALTLGSDVFNAYYKLETVEHYATISMAVRQLGMERELPPERIAQLMEVRQKMGIKGAYPELGKVPTN